MEKLWFTNNTTLRMTTTKSYDYLNRLTGNTSAAGGSNVAVFNYANNAANQRTAITNVDSSRWVYQYDALGQVVSGRKYWSDGTPVAGQQFEYGFDDIGNRKSAAAGGDAVGANLRYASYTANNLNQYTSREVPGFVNVLGTATNTATVSLWGDNGAYSATSRKGDYFRGELGVTNTANPVWLTITNLAVLNNGSNPDIVTNTIGKTYVAKTPEAFYYDLDGNLTNDGHWTYTWDAENRLTKVESLSGAPTASKRKVVWEFDGKGRRIRQTTYNGSSGSYVATEDLKFLADGWRHIAELNATNNALLRSYSWGLDMGRTLDAAGGVGGLLMLSSVANGVHFYAYDGNGNVAALVKTTDGSVSANYEYDPFGGVLRSTGLMADENRFQFSTKRTDRTTDLELYEYRVRHFIWLSRDPIEEDGGENLYGFACNNGIGLIDPIGLKAIRLAFGFDSSARADKKTMAFILESVIYLKTKLSECAKKADCDCPDLKGDFTVATSYDYDTKNKPKPTDNDYDMDTSDRQLRDDNLGKIKIANYTIRILITRSSIHQTWLGERTGARANTDKNGTLLAVGLAVPHTIAHEIGHFAGYVGDAPGDTSHAKDVENLMHSPGGEKVDCQWCQKVSALAK
ncbi:MAG: RHS repeat-associated core domain-containing protein [Verrucomicrobiae bacterium]|nr:RHS repeat-associated core domain-containing protein [Verrucomicrobiae bacterium]